MIEAGTRLFAERDYDAVSMEEIARAADVSKPMVYAYFESKQQLLMACIDRWAQELMLRLEEATPTSLPPDVRMWEGLLAFLSFVEERPEGWALLYPDGPRAGGQLAAGAARTRDAVAALLNRMLYDAAVAQGIDRDVAREATEPLAYALGAAAQAAANWWLRHGDEPKERLALRLMNFTWMGLDNLVRGKLWLPPPPGAAQPAGAPAVTPPAHAEQLRRRLREDRDGVLDDVFQRMADHVDPKRVGDLDAVIEWRIGGREDGGSDRFQLHIAGGACHVEREGDAQPQAVLALDALDFLELIWGDVRGSELFTFGKMTIEGDVVLAARMPRFFDGAGWAE